MMEAQASKGAAFQMHNGRRFMWKTILLTVTTLALVPILLYKDVLWAQIYLWTLVVIHVAGIGLVVYGTKRHHIAPDRRGLVVRIIGLTTLTALLYLAAKGLNTEVGTWLFWGALFSIWALHTVGLLFLHVRSRREARLCPFA
jgi:hypothetical protein